MFIQCRGQLFAIPKWFCADSDDFLFDIIGNCRYKKSTKSSNEAHTLP